MTHDADMSLHDKMCYHLLKLRHLANYSAVDIENEFDHLCQTWWPGDPFISEHNLRDDILRLTQFCKVSDGPDTMG